MCDKKTVDLLGLGKIAEAIPDSVYEKATDEVCSDFNKAISPITELTSGIGRYIKQKFDNMVDVEKALCEYSITNAVNKAKNKAAKKGITLIEPVHLKSFIRSIEEAAKENNSILHEMWENLISEQLINQNFHPHFVDILSNLSPAEANILNNLLTYEKIGENGGGFIFTSDASFSNWVRYTGDRQIMKWDYSCVLLLEYRLVDVAGTKSGDYTENELTAILYLTETGKLFLSTVQ